MQNNILSRKLKRLEVTLARSDRKRVQNTLRVIILAKKKPLGKITTNIKSHIIKSAAQNIYRLESSITLSYENKLGWTGLFSV